MTTLFTKELIDRCHAGSRSKGFWEPVPNAGQQLMLIISELAECLEAHRKGTGFNQLVEYKRLAEEARVGGWAVWGDAKTLEDRERELFAWKVKDSPGDELADAYIRICDFVGGFELPVVWGQDKVDESTVVASDLPANFAEALLTATTCLTAAYTEYANLKDKEAACYLLGGASLSIEILCEREGIDLATHIDLKLKYNASRPYKHAKNY